MPHTPNAAQLSKLATLQATQAAAYTSYTGNVTALAVAQTALKAASEAVKNYEAFIYGGVIKSTVIDPGNRDAV